MFSCGFSEISTFLTQHLRWELLFLWKTFGRCSLSSDIGANIFSFSVRTYLCTEFYWHGISDISRLNLTFSWGRPLSYRNQSIDLASYMVTASVMKDLNASTKTRIKFQKIFIAISNTLKMLWRPLWGPVQNPVKHLSWGFLWKKLTAKSH